MGNDQLIVMVKTYRDNMMHFKPRLQSCFSLVMVILTGLVLSGCYSLNLIENIGDMPKITPIKNPTTLPHYHPVTMPMPRANIAEKRINSLWQPGARGFFKDQRAKNVGDILRVRINIDDEQANFSSNSGRARQNNESLSISGLAGIEARLNKVLPKSSSAKNLIGVAAKPTYKGSGGTARKEKVKCTLAATIVQILPNGNYVISGRQETRVNFENREVSLTGIIRPSDITADNIVSYDKIAEARMSYGGRGHIMDYQQPPIGSQIISHLSPF